MITPVISDVKHYNTASHDNDDARTHQFIMRNRKTLRNLIFQALSFTNHNSSDIKMYKVFSNSLILISEKFFWGAFSLKK